MPTFMQNADRIVGGEVAPSMIPWQVAMLSGSFQFCGGTILDECTILTAAHCSINTGHTIRAGSTTKTSGGQVIINLKLYLTICYYLHSLRLKVLHKLFQIMICHTVVQH